MTTHRAVPRLTDIPFPLEPFQKGRTRPVLPVLEGAAAWHYGVDLFNAGYFWEAHEIWEPLWRVAADGSVERVAFKALIQIAASRVKLRAGNVRAARRLAERAAGALDALGAARFRGVDLAELAAHARAIEDGAMAIRASTS